MFRRAAVSAKAAASGAGHSELSIALSEEKNVHEAAVKLIAAKTDASVYSYKWARGESNRAIQDVFLKLCGLTSVWSEAQSEFVHKYKEYRGGLKEVLHEERGIDEVRKQQATCASRLTKLKKQVDIARRKNDTSKLDSLMPELKTAISANDKSYEELEQKMDNLEAFKAAKVRESLVLLSEAYLTLANKMTQIFSAQKQLAELITPETVPNTNASSDSSPYEGGYEKSSQILETACQNLNFPVPRLPGERRSTLRMYLDGDSSGNAPLSPSHRGPLPLPSHFMKATVPQRIEATSLDKLDKEDLYASADDFAPRPSPRPAESLAEYVEPDEEFVPGRNAKPAIAELSVVKPAAADVSVVKPVDTDQTKKAGETRTKLDDYSKVQDMYEWVWQRQSQILSSDSGEYCQPFDVIHGKDLPGSNGAETKAVVLVRQRRKSTGQHLEEDSSGYLVPAEAVDRTRVKSSNLQGHRDSTPHLVENGGSGNAPGDSGEYAYARVMTTTTKPVPAQRSPKPQRRPQPPPRPAGPPGKRGSALFDTQKKENVSDDVLKAAMDDSDACNDDVSPR